MEAREEYFSRPKKFSYKKLPNAFNINKENIHPNANANNQKTRNNKREKLRSITQRYKISTDIRAFNKLKENMSKKT
jgi:hypothetical protein